jgi:hypothetical protein
LVRFMLYVACVAFWLRETSDLFYERSEKKVRKFRPVKIELPLVAPLRHRGMLSGSLEGSLV